MVCSREGVMSKKIFVSYNVNDKQLGESIKGWNQHNDGVVKGQFIAIEERVSHLGAEVIDHEIRNVMEDCDSVLFLIGNHDHSSPWIDREVELVISHNINCVAMRIPGSTGVLPWKLRGINCTLFRWWAPEVAHYLNDSDASRF